MDRDKLIAALAKADYDINWSDREFVMEYLEEIYGKMTDEELTVAAEDVGINPETGEPIPW